MEPAIIVSPYCPTVWSDGVAFASPELRFTACRDSVLNGRPLAKGMTTPELARAAYEAAHRIQRVPMACRVGDAAEAPGREVDHDGMKRLMDRLVTEVQN